MVWDDAGDSSGNQPGKCTGLVQVWRHGIQASKLALAQAVHATASLLDVALQATWMRTAVELRNQYDLDVSLPCIGLCMHSQPHQAGVQPAAAAMTRWRCWLGVL